MIGGGGLFTMDADARSTGGSDCVSAAAVISQATPLFTDGDGDGRFVWRAPTR